MRRSRRLLLKHMGDTGSPELIGGEALSFGENAG
jgi:hypothetical protein